MRFKLAIAIVLLGHMVIAQQNRSFFTGGGCPAITGVGHPVLMISHVHKFINDAMNSKNSYTSVDFIYHNKSAEDINGMSTYIFVFRLNAISQNMFLGIKFEAGSFNTMRLIQYMKLESLIMTGNVLGVDNISNNLNNPECGDLKYQFSFYGQRPTSNLPYTSFGRNGNSVNLDLLSKIHMTHGITGRNPKICVDNNYSQFTIIDNTFGSSGIPYADNDCSPSTVIPIHKLRIICGIGRPGSATYSAQSGPRFALTRYIQLIYNNPSGSGVSPGVELYAAGYDLNEIVEINIDQAHSLTFLYEDDFAWELITKDKGGNKIDQIGCGVTHDNQQVSEVNNTDMIELDPYNWLGFSNIFPSLVGGSIRTIRELTLLYYDP